MNLNYLGKFTDVVCCRGIHEASGDAGSALSLELTHNFMPQLQGMLFYNYGRIRIN